MTSIAGHIRQTLKSLSGIFAFWLACLGQFQQVHYLNGYNDLAFIVSHINCKVNIKRRELFKNVCMYINRLPKGHMTWRLRT